MKNLWKYISHFWYVAINWNIWMAFFMLYDNIRGSIKYGTGTFAPVELKDMKIVGGDIKKSSRYEAVSFYMLEKLFNAFRKLSGERTIVDLGCGKGRMMMVAAHFEFDHVTGIDFAANLCELAMANAQKKGVQFPGVKWEVFNEDVNDYDIKPTDCVFFMFNPFNEIVLKKFLQKLDDSCSHFPRQVYFLYASPQHDQLLLDDGYVIVYQKEKMYLKSIIAVRDKYQA